MNVTAEEILAIIRDTAIGVNVGEIRGNTVLRAAGLDSLEMMNVLLGVEEKYGIKIPDEHIDGLQTIDSIVDYLKNI